VRQQKIGAQLQRVLSELISREVNDPRVGNVTITSVSVSPDMKAARVYYVPFASQNPPEQVQEGLKRASGFLRREVAQQLGLRHTPRLEFVFDESIDRAARLTGLINKTRGAP
jgi:ribosome-binding factor A